MELSGVRFIFRGFGDSPGAAMERSIDAVIVQPCAAGLVEPLHVVEIPRGQEPKQGWDVESFFVVYLFQSHVKLRQQMVVCGAMLVDTGEALSEQELFFTLKVHLGEVDEAFELQGDATPVDSAKKHDPEFIQGIHQDAVLVVHGFDANNAFVTPRQQGHIYLPEQGQV
jgi:hypothetical protein